MIGLFEGIYILLLLDQLPNGLWGKSVTLKHRKVHTSETGKGSPSVSWFVVRALLKYADMPWHPAIQGFLEYTEDHTDPDSGATGLRVLVTTSPDAPQASRIYPNCRHTASAVSLRILLKHRIDARVVKAVTFLIKHQKGGGWGITPGSPPDCLSTARALQALIQARNYGIGEFVEEEIARTIPISITKGMAWLAENLEEGYWVFGGNRDLRESYTTDVVKEVPEFQEHYPEQYKQVMTNLAEYVEHLDICTPKGETDIGTASWAMLVMDRDHDKHRTKLEEKLSYLVAKLRDPECLSRTYAADWSKVLELCSLSFLKARLSEDRRKYLDSVVKSIESIEWDKQDDLARVLDLLPEEFHWIADAIIIHILTPEAERESTLRRTPLLSEIISWRKNSLKERLFMVFSNKMSAIDDRSRELDKFSKESLWYDKLAARGLIEEYAKDIERLRKGVQNRYTCIRNRVERANTPSELDEAEKEIEEWASSREELSEYSN